MVAMNALLDELDIRERGSVIEVVGPADLELRGVTHDSRHIGSDTLFACIRGSAVDGHDLAGQAVADGAVALLVDHRLTGVGDVPQIVVDDTRRRLGPISAAVYGHPSRDLTTVGITGTNGKTTTAQLLAAIFEEHGWQTGIVGTLHGERTTPEAPELQALLASFRSAGCGAAVMEVSSHALALHRVDGTRFDAVVFTNLGRDHLDLHGSTEEYFRAKARLFDPSFAPLAVINVDDTYGRLLADTLQVNGSDGRGNGEVRVVRISSDDLDDVVVDGASHSYRWGSVEVTVPIGGHFNVANSHAALVTAVELGVDPRVAVAGLAGVTPVPGRFEAVPAATERGLTVVVDYAHTPDGLAEVLRSARTIADPGSAVVIVFGAGGDRDREKRPEMGAVAGRLADRVIVTSDNPRREDPNAIIGDILGGMNDTVVDIRVEPDRRTAIAAALAEITRGDVLVVAGKGHERTQDLGDRVVEFDDRAVITELLAQPPADSPADRPEGGA